MKLPTDWQDRYFTAFPDIIFVRGASDAAAYDFARGELVPVPPVLCELVEGLEGLSCRQYIDTLPADQREYVAPYLSFLLRKDFGTLRRNKITFPPLNPEWDMSNGLLSAQLHLSQHSRYDAGAALTQITDQDCFQLELRLEDGWTSVSTVDKLLRHLAGTTLRSVNVYLTVAEDWMADLAESLFIRHPKLLHLSGYSATENTSRTFQPGVFRLSTDPLTPEEMNRDHYHNRYIVNYRYFTESRQFNPLLNRRVSLSEFGYWKNDLPYQQAFGHVSDRPLAAVLRDPEFTKLWRVNADRIVELKDSARRYAVWPTTPLRPLNDGSGMYTFSSSTSQIPYS